ncbi:MAG TPA: hypothetical protein VIR56_09875 [Solimonas sp.]
MQKHIVLKLLAGSALALSSTAFAASSGSGSSGSAGLGIDTGLGGSISAVVPGVSVSNSGKPGMGGPIQGVADLNAKKQDSKGK